VDTGFFFPPGAGGGKSGWGVILTSHLHPSPRLRINGTIPLLPQYTFMVRIGAIYIAPTITLFNEKI
jgi:hypothetical protein